MSECEHDFFTVQSEDSRCVNCGETESSIQTWKYIQHIATLKAELAELNSPVILSEWQELKAENAKMREQGREFIWGENYPHEWKSMEQQLTELREAAQKASDKAEALRSALERITRTYGSAGAVNIAREALLEVKVTDDDYRPLPEDRDEG